jgi:hypothetical protein
VAERFQEWKDLDTGIFRVNKVKEDEKLLEYLCAQSNTSSIPEGFVDYEPMPREYILTSVASILRIGTRVSDLYSKPYDQIEQQLRLGMESIKEKQEDLLVNSEDYGLLHNIDPASVSTRAAAFPHRTTWMSSCKGVERASFFLAPPAAIAASGANAREEACRPSP